MNKQVEALRKKLGTRKDHLKSFLKKLDPTLSLEEVLAAIEAKYGKKLESGNEENEESCNTDASSPAVEQSSEVEGEDSDNGKNINDSVPKSDYSGQRGPELPNQEFVPTYANELKVEVVNPVSMDQYCPITGKAV